MISLLLICMLSLPCYIFCWWILSLYHYMMIHSYLLLSVKPFALLFYYFFLSVLLQFIFSYCFPLIPHTVVAIITLSKTTHYCPLLCSPLCYLYFIRWWVPIFVCIMLSSMVKIHLSLHSFYCDTIFPNGIPLMIYIWAPILIYFPSFKNVITKF